MSTGLPPTFNPTGSPEGARRPRVFDPALQQYPSAFRPGDPAFARPEDAACWQAARRRATDHVLRAAAESAWGDHLILRGSRLLRAWAAEAREPGDLDWVVRPPSARLTDPWSDDLLAGLASAVAARPAPAGLAFVAGAVATADIWTYERAAGRRLVFPWQCPGLPGGSVQADVVFGEEVPDPPVAIPVPAADGGCVSTWAASAAQSLAWKLLWLDTDMHPQGKDLYDAVLLAERSRLSRELLERTFAAAGQVGLPETAGDMVRRWPVDWDNFVLESPWVAGTAAEWRERLIEALEPTFAGVSGDTVGNPLQSVAFDPRWRTADVLGLARGITEEKAFDRLPLLADALMDAGCDDEQVIGHCRCAGPHARGCWVIDLVLGKA